VSGTALQNIKEISKSQCLVTGPNLRTWQHCAALKNLATLCRSEELIFVVSFLQHRLGNVCVFCVYKETIFASKGLALTRYVTRPEASFRYHCEIRHIPIMPATGRTVNRKLQRTVRLRTTAQHHALADYWCLADVYLLRILIQSQSHCRCRGTHIHTG
jgi:hypothetical protein